MLRILKSKGVKMISPQELQFLLDGDSSSQPLIIDIRPTSEYDKGFITGAINLLSCHSINQSRAGLPSRSHGGLVLQHLVSVAPSPTLSLNHKSFQP